MADLEQAAPPSPWRPLSDALFRRLWIATIVSNVGTWMQDVGASWLMTSLSTSPALVALVEAADSLPVMLLALPAGAIADIVDRRRLLIAVQIYLLVVAGVLAAMTALDVVTPQILLGFISALAVGDAIVMAAWPAIVPELVPANQLPSAIALNSIAINISRTIGPAIAGVLVAAAGVWLVFALNALSYIGIAAVLLRWRRERRKSALPAERFFSAVRVGLRFIMHTRSLQVVLIHGVAFFTFASATWSLLPLIVRKELGRGPEIYGLLLTCIGVGAVGSAILLPRLRGRLSRDVLVAGASALYALAALLLAQVQDLAMLAVAMLATGMAWMAMITTLQVSAQLTLPPWVRARGLAAFVLVFMGGMGLGSILWGQVAVRIGVPDTLTIAALGMIVATAVTWRFTLGPRLAHDLTPSHDWPPAPVLAAAPSHDNGPVLVTIEYRVHDNERTEFIDAMRDVEQMRRRNGAYFWALFHDSADLSRHLECFMDESWIEHLRQHERASVADRVIVDSAKRFMVEGTSTRSRHWLADRGAV